MPFLYRLYGLSIASDLPVPGLRPTETGQPDVLLSFQQMPAELRSMPDDAGQLWWTSPWNGPDGRPIRVIRKIGEGQYYSILYNDGFRFVMDGACRNLWVTWPEGLTQHELAIYLLGPVMGTFLRLRGTVCLHASAVRIDDRAVAFLGDGGAGKSTTAAGFARAGHNVLADDVVTLTPAEGQYMVQPGYPHLRLCDDAVEKLYGSREALPHLVGTWDKRRLDLVEAGRFQPQPLPLGAVYILGRRSSPEAGFSFECVNARDAMMVLVANTYGNLQLDGAMRTQEFEFLGRFLQNVPVRKLTAPQDISLLPALCAAITEDLRATLSSAVIPPTKTAAR